MNLLEQAVGGKFDRTGATKKMTLLSSKDVAPNDVYRIPLDLLYYNDQNGRINTTYKQYQANHGPLTAEPGDSKYNEVFENLVFSSNPEAMKNTLTSIKEKSQQEPGVVLSDGRVIDGNRRFTALRKYQRETKLPKFFEAIILPFEPGTDEKKIKELELDLQLGREERVSYDPIDRIFDVYNTIKAEKLMSIEEYRVASGAKTSKGINKDLWLADLIIKFIKIISPDGNPLDKFYIARELKLDGPIEDIQATLKKLKDDKKEEITDAVLVRLAVSKMGSENKEPKNVMRDMKNYVLKNDELRERFLTAVNADEKLDDLLDAFQDNPVQSANDLKKLAESNSELKKQVDSYRKSSDNIAFKGQRDSERREVLINLEEMKENLSELGLNDFSNLTKDEFLDAKNVLKDMTDVLFKLKKDLNV